MRNTHECPFVAETLDRLKFVKKNSELSTSICYAAPHLCSFFLEQHFALNELVVRPGTRAAFTTTTIAVADDSAGAVLALIVKDEEKLIGHFLLYFDHFVITHKVEFGGLLFFILSGEEMGGEREETHVFLFLERIDTAWISARVFELFCGVVVLGKIIRQEMVAIRFHRSHNRTIQPRVVQLPQPAQKKIQKI